MKRISLVVVAALLAVNVVVQSKASAQEASPADHSPANEVDALKRRIEDLENQNRAMMQLLLELKSRMEVASPAGPKSATGARPGDASGLAPRVEAASLSRSAVRAEETGLPGSAVPEPVTGGSPQSSAEPKQSGASDIVRWSDLIGEGNRFKMYGLLRLDLDIDSQRPNNGQIPFFITSEDSRISKARAGNFSMHPRLTRFGVDYTGPRIASLSDGKLSGKLELDFENGGSESRQIIRIRHAYLKMDWGEFSILGGQTWDIASPLYPTVNNDSLMWNAGNIGDRRPQFRFSYEPTAGPGRWSLVGGIGLTGAIDPQDLDGNGFRDGEESGRPDVQARIGYSRSLWVKDQRAGLGVSGFYGWFNTTRPVAGRATFHSQALNIDYTLPLATRLSLRGEGWWGRNLSDVRGGAGLGINPSTGAEIRGRGGWSELSAKVSRYWSVHPGFTTDDPVDRDLPVGARTRNRAFYIGNRITPIGNLMIGVDYLRWKTNFKGFTRGLDNRFNIIFQYGF